MCKHVRPKHDAWKWTAPEILKLVICVRYFASDLTTCWCYVHIKIEVNMYVSRGKL